MMSDLTHLLDALHRGEPDAASALLAEVYAELRQLPKLQRLGTNDAKAGGGLPGQPVAEFWKEYDAKKP